MSKTILKNVLKTASAGLLAAMMVIGATACGTKEETPSSPPVIEITEGAETPAEDTADATEEAPSAEETPAAEEIAQGEASAEQTFDNVTIKIGASPTPHQEILETIVENLKAKGITLEIIPYNDYIQPNIALQEGSLDANYFQHKPYLDDFNEENKTDLVSLGAVHYEPMGLYPSKAKSIEELQDKAKIAVPNDPTNEARALNVLAANGIITLKEGAGVKATKQDIVENPKNIEIMEIEAAQVPLALPDVDMAVINSNFALSAGLDPTKDPIVAEKSNAGYENIVAIRAGDETRPELQALMEALLDAKTKTFIQDKYQGAVVAVD